MSGEIVVPETPNWLNVLEAKREKRLKTRLGHETGAGAPCLKCGDKCPGLDLHFWRKSCKICRCAKEDHDVPDDDIHGWAQFQLLGSKPNKIKTKIVLPGKNDEVELEWAPKGQKETIEKYLKTLPPEALPVKGSQAAQERKQLLQKQIPFHDIDPSLCHELNEEEVAKMEEYIAHVKKSSVGVGQIVNLSSVIKGNLHNISPQEAHIIASRYSKGIPFSEIVKLQSGLAGKLENLTVHDPKAANKLPAAAALQPPKPISEDHQTNVVPAAKFKAITQPWYTNSSPGKGPLLHPQYSENLRPSRLQDDIDPKLLKGTNFDPSKTPSRFAGFENPYFNHRQQNLNSPAKRLDVQPRSVKDLMYSTYDPGQGPLPTADDVFRRPHGQEQIRFDPLLGRNIPEVSRYPEQINYNSLGRGVLDPSSGNYVLEDGAIATPKDFQSFGHPVYGEVIFDPHTANCILEDGTVLTPKYPRNQDVFEERPHFVHPLYGKLVFDPRARHCALEDGTVVPLEDPRYSQLLNASSLAHPVHGKCAYDPKTFNYTLEDGTVVTPEDPGHPELFASMPNIVGRSCVFDPETGNFIFEDGAVVGPKDPRYSELSKAKSRISHYPSRLGHFRHPVYGTCVYDPKTRHYIVEDGTVVTPKHPQYSELLGNNPKCTYDPDRGHYILEDGTVASPKDPRFSEILGSSPSQYPKCVFDASTGNFILGNEAIITPEDSRYPELIRRDLGCSKQPYVHDPRSGYYILEDGTVLTPEDQKYPGHPVYGKCSFDPKTGNCTLRDGTVIVPSDPRYQEVIRTVPRADLSFSGSVFDPKTGDYVTLEDSRHAELRTPKKPLLALQPGRVKVPEDFLEPHMVNVGAIQDINPNIRAATTEINPGYADNSAEYSPESIREILNNIKLPDCHYCKKPFEENEFAVTIDRANVLFHAQCFKCAGCNQSLADNIYFYDKESNNVYCGRDYAKIKGYPRCAACDELIFTKEYCLAENSTFHLKHFCCFQCDTPLAGQEYTLEDDKTYCLPCYETSKAAKCSTCERVIKTDEVGCQLNGVHFHAEDRCFRCIVCSVPLMGKKLLLRNEKLYCSHDCFNSAKK